MAIDKFVTRHIGPREKDIKEMLATIDVSSLDELIDQTVPSNIRLEKPLNLPNGLTEREYYRRILHLASKNKVFNTYIGMGWYDTITPAVILRNILENPAWYTSYTPYQAEISQGRLEALLNFQTMVCEMTAMPLANASLLDEATAAAEALHMMFALRSRAQEKAGANVCFVDEKVWPQTLDVLYTRAEPLGIVLEVGDFKNAAVHDKWFGAIVQYPNSDGIIESYEGFTKKVQSVGAKIAVAADLLSLALLTPPGEWGADIVFGSTQRFGVPMGYGGPSAAFFSTRDEYKRDLPGRIIGVSKDSNGKPALSGGT
jgi:glycine dehydrogenase